MSAATLHPADFLRRLADAGDPLVLRRGVSPEWNDQPLHNDAWAQDAELYALSAVAEEATIEAQSRVLIQLLRQGRADLSADVRLTLDRVAALLLDRLPTARVLTVFLALRRLRVNHKHTRRAMLRYLLNHPRLERLASQRRPTMVDLIEHALGRNTARGCVKRLDDADASRPLLRWASDTERVLPVLRYLYRLGPLPTAPAEKDEAAPPAPQAFVAPKTVTATNRGDIAATLVHLYRGGDSPELRHALAEYVERAARGLPRFDGWLALVLDASASTQGYGEREFCCVAQSHALRLVLERVCGGLRVYTVGGAGDPPRPAGPTDLAGAVLDAAADEPDLIAVVSDGYENFLQGDLADVADALPLAGCEAPVVFCHSKFTAKDDLSWRQPAPRLAQLEFWHEADFAPLLRRLFARAHGLRGRQFLRQHLQLRLETLEKEKSPWPCIT